MARFSLVAAARRVAVVMFALLVAQIGVAQCFPDATDVTNQLGITDVQLGSLSNNVGPPTAHYTDYTSLTPPQLPRSTNHNLAVTASTNFTIAIWFDWNRDNIFDATEKLTEQSSPDSVTATVFPFTVPSSAMTGNVRLRIRAIQNVTGVDPCDSAPGMADVGNTHDYFVDVRPAIQITTTTLPNAVIGANYSQSLSSTGGVGTKTWAIVSGGLPQGVVFNSVGLIVGVPQAGTSNAFPYTMEVSVTDQATPVANVSTAQLELLVMPFQGIAITIVTNSLPNGTLGQVYGQQIFAVNGANPNQSPNPYNFALTGLNGGFLPPGLSMTNQGNIAGTPTQLGVFSFQVEARDPANFVATQNLTITVVPAAGGGGGGGGGTGGGGTVTLEGGGGCALLRRSEGTSVLLLSLLGVLGAIASVRRRRAA